MPSKYLLLALIPVLIFSQLVPTPAISSRVQSSDWDLIGQAGGPTQGIAVQGDYAYMGVGPRLVVVDISDPVNPRQVGYSPVFGDFVLDVVVSGNYAYVTAGGAGLQVIDITNPLAPVPIGTWDSPGFAEGVTVSGDIAYLADGPYGLRVVDVANPAMPFEIAHAFDMNYAYAVAVDGRYAYIAAGGAGLLVVEISNLHYPIEAGAYDTPGNARGLAVLNNLVYVADERYGLQIIDVTDPLHPTLLGTFKSYGWAFDVVVSDSTAYLAAAFGGLRVLNVLDPADPQEIGSLAWEQSNAVGLALADGSIYLTDRKNGLRVISNTNPTNPLQTGLFSPFREALMVVTSGNYAYVAAGYNGVHILDISDPSQPVEVGAYPMDAIITQLKVDGDRLYAGCFGPSGAWGDYVLDVSDPTQPQFISFGQWCGECHGIDAAGNIGYFADTNGVRIVDFSDPAHPQQIKDTQENTSGLLVSGNLAYVPRGSELKIYDVSDPAAPLALGTFQDPLGFLTQNVVLSGNYAYVNDWWGVRILDVTDPTDPFEVAFHPTPFDTQFLAVSGNRLYVAEGSSGVEVVDVTDPANPISLGSFDTPGSAQSLAIAGSSLLVADAEGGLQIYSLAALKLVQTGDAADEPAAVPNAQAVLLSFRQARPDFPVITRPPLPSDTAPDRSATNCVVTSAADSGAGTLRECLLNQVSGDVITFDPAVFPPANPVTIYIGPERLFWLVEGNITVDASNAGVILDGTNIVGELGPGIGIMSDNNIVRGLQIYHFLGSPGINVIGNNNIIGGSRLIGSGPTGQGNVLSANLLGLAISDQGNQILGNIIGLDASGTEAMANEVGIGISGAFNTIGSLEAGENNIISASVYEGIGACAYIDHGNQIIGNYVGTDITGTLDRGNGGVGIYIECGTNDTLVQGNLVSGNQLAGVVFGDHSSDFNVAIGNRVGVTLDGTQPLLNGGVGIYVGESLYSRIGGGAPGEGNLVGTGTVEVGGRYSGDTLVQGNRIGLDAAGMAVLPNAGGIVLLSSTRTIVGGATPAEANFVTTLGNFSLDIGSANNVIAGNFLGLALDGVTPLTTASFQILSTQDGNIIQGNQIANATSAGIWVDRAQANTIRQNLIWANPFKGIYLDNGANNNLPAPVLALSAAGGSGTTCPGCVVELFLDEGNQGRFYLNSVTADSAGVFNFPAYCPLPYPNLTATATDLQGNTSQFSDPQTVAWDCSSARTIPILVSIDPTNQP
ncbi:MAG TPA: NosD domain-containing protein, partial [Anaerolineaceae bacterium]|nr:NosD domain-containing protein [Anaerolineaceae bacterium]